MKIITILKELRIAKLCSKNERTLESNFRCMYCRMIVQWFDRKKVKVLCLNAEACRQIEVSLIKLIQELDTDVGQGVKYQQVSTWLS